MSLKTLQNAAADLDREERLSAARRTLQDRIPRPGRERRSSGHTAPLTDRFRARLQLAAFRVQRNAPAIRSTVRQCWTTAVALTGALLVSYGCWTWNPGLGYVVGGILLWVIQWNSGDDETPETHPGTPPGGRQTAYGRN